MSVSPRNNKLGKIPNVSMTPIKSCGFCPCKRACYALKAYRMYKETRESWDSNYRMATKDPEKYFAMIEDYLTRHRTLFFRWHGRDTRYLEICR